jgi:WD40 repeat protein
VFAFDIATGVTRDLNPTHNSRVQALAFSADGKRLASTSFESEIYLWDVEQGSAINRCQVARLRKARGSEEDYAVRLAFAPDDKHLLAQQWDQSVRLYAPAQGREVVAFRNAGYIWGFTDNGRHVHWTPTKLLPQSPFSPPQPEPDDLDHWLGVTRWVASAAAYPVLGQFRARTFAPTRIPDLGLRADSPQLRIYEEGTPFNLSPDGSVLAESLWRPTGNPNAPWERHVLRFSDATTGKEIARVPIKADDNVLWFAPDSRSFVTQVRIERNEALEYSLVLVETRTGQERLRISTHPYSFYDCRYAFSRDGRWLAIGRHKTIEVFDLVRGASAATIPHHDEYPCFAFSPDGSLLASGGDSRTILLWDMTALMKRKFNEAPWSADDKERLWNDLANADAAKAFAAIMRLKRSPPAAIALIRDRWGRRMQNVDLGKLIKQLQSDDFATRKRATDAIEQIGEGAYAALAEALPRTKSLEDRRRIEALMVQCERPFTTPARLRLLRSIEVLDALGTPDAGALLREIAADSAGDEPLQREITRALERFSTPHAAR